MEQIFRVVSVKERLPSNCANIFVFIDYSATGGQHQYKDVSYYDKQVDGWGGKKLNVTHWFEKIILPSDDDLHTAIVAEFSSDCYGIVERAIEMYREFVLAVVPK